MSEQEAIEQLTRALLPGGAGFPAADPGIALVLAERLRHADAALPAKLLDFLAAETPVDPAAWTATAAKLEAVEPALFAEFRKYAYLTYYEQPAVIAAIRALGHPYNDSPLPDGYPDEPFDPARDVPRHAAGFWRDRDDIRPVDVAALDLGRSQ